MSTVAEALGPARALLADAAPTRAPAVAVARALAERTGEWAVIGLGRSGEAAAALLRAAGLAVYASDAAPGASEAAARLAALGVDAVAGSHDLARIAHARAVVVSPGVPPDAPALAAAHRAGVPVVSEVEVALRLAPGLRCIAVTGTNGKTTTTALIGHLLRTAGVAAADAGNIGRAVAEVVRATPRPDWVALELSSFQLHDTPGLLPDVGVLTTLSPDHLDRYPTLGAYYADKARLFLNADASSRWVWNGDDPTVTALAAGVPGRHHRFSLVDPGADAHAATPDGALVLAGDRLLPRAELPLLGPHNVANALAAVLAVWVSGAVGADGRARAALVEGLRSFRAPAHRLELVAERDGVRWLDDSKATNVASTLVALQAMSGPTVVLLGGRHKGEPYTALRAVLAHRARHVIAFGEAAGHIMADLAGAAPLTRLGSDFAEVVVTARRLARPGDTVLLSPACSSYDMFPNYEVRGATFRALALGQESP